MPGCLVPSIVIHIEEVMSEDFPDDPVVKTLPSNAKGASLTAEQGTENPHALQPKQTNKQTNKQPQNQYCNKFNESFTILKKTHTH